MPFQKHTEQGWFYHAPASRRNAEPVGAPPASQIPGLSDVSSQPLEAPKRTMFRDTDSDYVKLAKQGGRQDLLQNNYALRGRSKAAIDYPRVDWYYLEDNQTEDAQDTQKSTDKDYKFLLPEYMVHEEYLGDKSTNFRPKRAPFGYDTTQVYEREADPTKKDLKLPEVKPSGYGVRSEKLKNKPVPHDQPPPPKPIIQNDTSYKGRLVTETKDDISKILSFDYSREWQETNQAWGKNQQNAESNTRKGEVFATEYQMGFAKQPPKAGRRATPKSDRSILSPDHLGCTADGPTPRTAAQAVQKDTNQDKELFKLSRFKNIPARTESHRRTTLPAGM